MIRYAGQMSVKPKNSPLRKIDDSGRDTATLNHGVSAPVKSRLSKFDSR